MKISPFLGSPGGHNRPGTLMAADRAKQMFGPQVLTVRGVGMGVWSIVFPYFHLEPGILTKPVFKS